MSLSWTSLCNAPNILISSRACSERSPAHSPCASRLQQTSPPECASDETLSAGIPWNPITDYFAAIHSSKCGEDNSHPLCGYWAILELQSRLKRICATWPLSLWAGGEECSPQLCVWWEVCALILTANLKHTIMPVLFSLCAFWCVRKVKFSLYY